MIPQATRANATSRRVLTAPNSPTRSKCDRRKSTVGFAADALRAGRLHLEGRHVARERVLYETRIPMGRRGRPIPFGAPSGGARLDPDPGEGLVDSLLFTTDA